jgi:hypothetical protein
MSLRGFIAAARYHNMNLLEFLGEFVGPLLVLLVHYLLLVQLVKT